MLFTQAGVLMVCHVNACALFKVITPFQSATGMQLLTSWPCIFHVLLLVSSITKLSQRDKKAAAGRRNKTCSLVWTYSKRATYPGLHRSCSLLRPGRRGSPQLPFQLAPTTAVCISWHSVGSASSTHLWPGGQGGEGKEKEKRKACGKWLKLPTLSWTSLKPSTIWLPSRRYRPWVYLA